MSLSDCAASLIVIGAGGHASVVLDTYLSYSSIPIRLADDNLALDGAECLGAEIIAPISNALAQFPQSPLHLAIGDNAIRHQLYHRLSNRTWQTIVSPRAVISPHALLHEGVFIAPGAIVSVKSVIGPVSIINHQAVVDHDCIIGAACHVAPGAVLSGGVTLGDEVFIGAGACVLPGITIGDRCVVGAGAVVTRDVAADLRLVGMPAKPMTSRSNH